VLGRSRGSTKCNFSLSAPTFRVGGGTGALLELLLVYEWSKDVSSNAYLFLMFFFSCMFNESP
jgi:hypothetical protein